MFHRNAFHVYRKASIFELGEQLPSFLILHVSACVQLDTAIYSAVMVM